jgi:hypothetical protein
MSVDTTPDAISAAFAESYKLRRRRKTYHTQEQLIICQDCGRMIDESAADCPHCAVSRAVTNQRLQMLFVALVAVAFLGRVFLLFLS